VTAIIIPRRHLAQPHGRIAPNPRWADRLLSLVYLGDGGIRDLVDSTTYSSVGAISQTAFGAGVGVNLNPANGFGTVESVSAMAGYAGDVTVLMFLPEIRPTGDEYGMMLYGIPSVRYSQFLGAGGVQMYSLGAGPIATPGGEVYGTRNRTVVFRHAGEKAVFVDKRKQTYSAGTSALLPGAKIVRIGAWAGSGWTFNGIIASAAVFAGALEDGEVFELVDRPWDLYRADPTRIYSLPAGPIALGTPIISHITAAGFRVSVGVG